jgi:hypothetical protein
MSHPFRKNILDQLKEHYYNSSFVCDGQIISGYCCEYCDALNSNVFSIEELFEDLRIQSKNCTRVKGCNCTIGFIPQRDNAGHLVKVTTARDLKYQNYE